MADKKLTKPGSQPPPWLRASKKEPPALSSSSPRAGGFFLPERQIPPPKTACRNARSLSRPRSGRIAPRSACAPDHFDLTDHRAGLRIDHADFLALIGMKIKHQPFLIPAKREKTLPGLQMNAAIRARLFS